MNESADTDALAAEYVLGTLDRLERAHAQVLLATDPNFAANVRAWERRLGELHLMVEPVDPDPELWERIKSKIPAVVPSPEPAAAEPDTTAAMDTAPPSAAPAEIDETAAAPAAETAPAIADVTAPAAGPPPPFVPTPPVPSALTPSADLARASDTMARAPAAPPPPAVSPMPQPADVARLLRRRLRRWRAFAVLLLLMIFAAAGLVAAWRYAPERLPPRLQPVELLRLVGVMIAPQAPAPRPSPPPAPDYEE